MKIESKAEKDDHKMIDNSKENIDLKSVLFNRIIELNASIVD